MNEEELQILKEHIEKVIDERVNGKIDRLDNKVDKHMKEMSPFLTGFKGAKIIGVTIKWVAGVVIAVGGAIALFKSGF